MIIGWVAAARRIAHAEWRKAVLAPRGTYFHVAFVGVSLAGALLMGVIARQAVRFHGPGADAAFLRPAFSAIGLLVPGVLIAMAGCAYRVASDYDDGTVSETFRAMPRRTPALAVKTALLATSFALPTLVLMPVLYLVTESLAAGHPVLPQALLAHGGVRPMLAVPVVVWCLCAMSAALASVLRNPASAIAVPLAWYALVEELLPRLPGIGGLLRPVLPVANGWLLAAVDGPDVAPWVPLVILLAWVAVITGSAALLLERRDVPARS